MKRQLTNAKSSNAKVGSDPIFRISTNDGNRREESNETRQLGNQRHINQKTINAQQDNSLKSNLNGSVIRSQLAKDTQFANLGVGQSQNQFERQAELASHPSKSSQYKNTTQITPAFTRLSAGETPAMKATPQVVDAISDSSEGQTVDPGLIDGIRTSFGIELPTVKVHKNPHSINAAASISARAFSYRNKIFLGQHGSVRDNTLMSHELAHVAQYAQTGFGIVRRTPEPDSLTRTVNVNSMTEAQLQTEIFRIQEWIRTNPRNSVNGISHDILGAALQRLQRPIQPPMRRRSTGSVRATRRTVRNLGGGVEPVVESGRARTPAPQAPVGPEGRMAERSAERAARLPQTEFQRGRAFAASEQIIAPGVIRRPRPTVSSSQVTLNTPIEHVPPARVQELARQAGLNMPRFLATHAELQQTTANPNNPVGVNRIQCQSCFAVFVHLARHRGQTQVISDPQAIRYFHPNGEVIEVWRDGTRVRFQMSTNGRRILSASVLPPNVGGGTSGGGTRTPARASQAPSVPAAIPTAARTPAITPTGGGAGGPSAHSPGVRVAAGGLGIIMIANEVLAPIARIQSLQRRNIQMGIARVDFWRNITGEEPEWAVWDQDNRQTLAQTAELTTSVFIGRATFPYVVDVDLQAFRRNLLSKMNSFNDFALFLDMAKTLQAINETPSMPARPSVAERNVSRRYIITLNGPTESRRRIDITTIIEAARARAILATDRSERSSLSQLSASERGQVFRLTPGSQTNIFRSAHGSQNIRSSQQLFGPDPWVRPLGARMEGGFLAWFTQGHASDRLLVEPANGDARRGISPASYQIYENIDDVRDEVREGGRAILDEQRVNGNLQSFVGGPSVGDDNRFGMVRYYIHPSNPSWSVAIGELNQFWVDASDMELVRAEQITSYLSASGD